MLFDEDDELSGVFKLSPNIHWNYVDQKNLLQVRFPNGDHVSFEHDLEAINQILTDFASGQRYSGDRLDLVEELVVFLTGRHALTTGKDVGSDWFADILDYILAASRRQTTMSSVLDSVKQSHFVIVGQGWLADRAREACAMASLSCGDDMATAPTDAVVVAVSDAMRFDFFSRSNADALKADLRILFMWREVARIVAGPLVIPSESSCFECYRTRLRSNSRFTEEFDAHAALSDDRISHIPSALVGGMVTSLIARHLMIVAAGAHELIEPGRIYSYDTLTLEQADQLILRVPRCAACRNPMVAPVRAVRSIA